MAAVRDDWLRVLGEPQRTLSCLTFPICMYIRRVYVSITGARIVDTNLVLNKTENRGKGFTLEARVHQAGSWGQDLNPLCGLCREWATGLGTRKVLANGRRC